MIPQVFHRVWLGPDPIPAQAEIYHQSWLTRHPGWDSRLWRDDDFGWLKNQTLFDRASSFAQRADIARYEVIRKFGGIFLDVDMECLRPVDGLVAGVCFFAGRESHGSVANGFFGAVPDHPLLTQVIDTLPVSCIANRRRGVNMQTGPGLLTTVIDRYAWDGNADVRLFPPEFFYPYDFTEPWRSSESFPRAFAVHHWAKSWQLETGVRVGFRDLSPDGWADTIVKTRELLHVARARCLHLARERIREPAVPLIKSVIRRALPTPTRSVHGIPWGKDEILVAGPLGTRLLVPVEDLSVAPELALDGTYEPAFVEFLVRCLRPGMAFVDVGANVGFFTIVAAQLVGPGGHVYSYECNPDLVTRLEANIKMNWFQERVTVVPKAAGPEKAVVKLSVPQRFHGLGSTARNVDIRGEYKDVIDVDVLCEPVAGRLANIGYVDLMKIDVEGAESGVVKGAGPLFAAGKVGMLCLEFRSDVLTSEGSAEMRRQLEELQDRWTVTFHDPGSPREIPLEQVLVKSNFSNLVIRFPHSTIDPA